MRSTELLTMGFRYQPSTDTYKHEIIEVRFKDGKIYRVERLKDGANKFVLLELEELSKDELESILLTY